MEYSSRSTNSGASKEGETSHRQAISNAAPSITLPKGGGAIRGIGEKFTANPVTGTGSISLPIATSSGRSGFGPQLSLSYDSGAGNGTFGFGWSLSIPSITRKTDKGLPKYQEAEESDEFILFGSEDLVPLLKEDGSRWSDIRNIEGTSYRLYRYRPRTEGLFARIERWTNTETGEIHWRSLSKDNILTLYGKDAAARISDPKNSTHIFSWLICEICDDKGNVVLYEYKSENGDGVDLGYVHERNRGARDDTHRAVNRYLKHIKYGNRKTALDDNGHRPSFLRDTQLDWMFEVVFDYGEHDVNAPQPNDSGQWNFRLDPFSTYRAGFEVRTTRLCQRVLMFHHFPEEEGVGENCLVRSTDFNYSHEQDPISARNPVYTFLKQVTQAGYKRNGNTYLKRSLPPLEFEYTQPIVQDIVEEVDPVSLENLPIGVDGASYQWTDLHGEGIPGILTEQGAAWYYKRNLSPRNFNLTSKQPVEFAPIEHVMTKPNLALAGGAQFMDLAGDGQPDLVMLDNTIPGLYEHDEEEGWQSFRPFKSLPNHEMRSPNLKFIDLDGDGHADVLITEDEAFIWHASLAENGFGPAQRMAQSLDEEKGPRLIFADATQSIYLADLSGDGLTDLVRIRNGEICYWPNLGYGRFGAKIAMDHPPFFDNPTEFEHERIRLADIDGTGTTDVIYLHREGIRLYFNQSGNSWSEPVYLNVFSRVDDLVNIAPTDLLGNGTACLVWSSPLQRDMQRPMRYVNLMGEHKPHLLIKTINNLGAETRVKYLPSTYFYLKDKQEGKPWVTRLPFPVHVVERVETFDHISNNYFVTRYAYHHGYFDGEEREFRGFGMVEQFDTEQFSSFAPIGGEEAASNIDETSHVAPVHTKTWFHTGIYLGRGHVTNFFAGLLNERDVGEYYREPGLSDIQARQLLLEDTVLPEDLTVEEEREACRALKGAMLRQEVYALDGTDKAKHPYNVVEQNFTVRLLQPRDKNRHAVFFTHTREAVSYHYERNPSDPRISHVLTLEVDGFGNVLKSAAIGYGRRQPDPTLSVEAQTKQTEIHVTYRENNVTNAIEDADVYRSPLPSESRCFELTGLHLPMGQNRFTVTEMLTAGAGAVPIDYEQNPAASILQKRWIEQVRTYYRPDDLGAVQNNNPLIFLPLGKMESQALPGESYQLTFTPGLLNNVYKRNGQSLLPANPADVLEGGGAERGGYVDLDKNDHWWLPSGRVFFSPNITDNAAAELTHARSHFFLPHRYRNPFHTDVHNTETVVIYDDHKLLTVETRDALSNTIRAQNDYRILAARLMTDPNGNRSEVAFDIFGMVVATAVKGKIGQTLGDLLEDFDPDPPLVALQAFVADPHGQADSLLGKATTRIVYDLDRYLRSGQPPFIATLARETHFFDPGGPETKIQVGFSYSDGFGREIQKKMQAERGDAPQRGPDVMLSSGDVQQGALVRDANGKPVQVDTPQRWVGSGRTVFNNKGKPVRQYEPFFSSTPLYEQEREMTDTGVSPILFYDPVERVVATLHPNHTWEKVIVDSWQQETWDINDTVLIADPKTDANAGDFFRRLPAVDYLPTWYQERISRPPADPERQAAEKAAMHAGTPAIAHTDSLGRTFLTIAHNRFERNGALIEEHYATRVVLDIEGNQREVIDAKDRIVMRYDYDMLSNRIHQVSMEAGERWMLNDVAGNPLYAWNSRNHQFRTAYDPLRRSIETSFREDTGPEFLIERTVYGETRPNPEANNLRGKMVQLFDQAGVATTDEYDFKSNLLRSQRQLAEFVDPQGTRIPAYKTTVDWSDSIQQLETDIYISRTRYDALNRATEQTAPDLSVYHPTFNEANLLEKVDIHLHGAAVAMPFVRNIDYNARGQRVLIEYGNQVKTEYEYDVLTFRLIRLKTTRLSDQTRLQDLNYTYDPAGNITQIEDAAQQTIYFNNQVVTPSNDYSYDAVYRLIQAKGREHIGQSSQPQTTWDDQFRVHLPHPGDGQAMRRYSETYYYDAVGNFEQLIHQAANSNWIRSYAYNEDSLIEPAKKSNRLSSTTAHPNGNQPIPEPHSHDAHGNMTTMRHLSLMQWDFKDQLRATARQVVNEGTPETTYYVYDAAGQRVRKVTERQAAAGQTSTRKKERIYLGGFEIYREYENDGNTVELKREALHIMDDKQRIALVEIRTQGNDGSPAKLVRYQFGNHLGSATLELDEEAQILSYEEYYPYGSTSYQADRSATEVSLKRYRYTGKERDEESGLNYHGARYYAPWIGTWLSTDPAGILDHINMYVLSRNNPINFMDRNGRNSNKVSEAESALIDERTKLKDLVENRLPETLSSQRQLEVELKSTEASIKQLESDIKGLNPKEAGFAAQKQKLEAELLRKRVHYGLTRSDLEIAGERVRQVKADIKKSQSTVKNLARRVTKLGGDPNVERGDVRYGKADQASLAETEVDDLERKIDELEGKKTSTPAGDKGTGGGGGTKKKSGPARRWRGYGGKALQGAKFLGKAAVVVGAVVSGATIVWHLAHGDIDAAAIEAADFFTFGGVSYAKEKIEEGMKKIDEGIKAYQSIREFQEYGPGPVEYRKQLDPLERLERKRYRQERILKGDIFVP